jgi:SET domain-containing protein
MYIGCCLFISESITKYTIIIGSELYSVDTTNSVRHCQNGVRQVYGFDGFMNHSCDPNIICNEIVETTEQHEVYKSIALKDIEVGDEITCDYALFDYTCNGHEIDPCLCGAANCRGSMKGFGAMTLQQQVEVLHLCDETIIQQFLIDNKHVTIVDIAPTMPEGVSVKIDSNNEMSLFATKSFRRGDLVFRNCIEEVRDFSKRYIIKYKDNYKLLVREDHFIARDDFVEFLGFDTFMNHSCDPSTEQTYVSGSEYCVYAKRDIEPQSELTCDYHLLTNQASQQQSLVTIEFQCLCGSANCRGQMKA